MFDTFTKNAHGITQWPTLNIQLNVWLDLRPDQAKNQIILTYFLVAIKKAKTQNSLGIRAVFSVTLSFLIW